MEKHNLIIVNDNKFNTGIALLKIWMIFGILIIHIFVKNDFLFNLKELAAPIFITISFMFLDIDKLIIDNSYLKKRFKRLLIPHIVWSVIYYIIFIISFYAFNLDISHSIVDFIQQLLFGNGINGINWFFIVLIWLTILFYCIFKFLNKRVAITLTIILCISILVLRSFRHNL